MSKIKLFAPENNSILYRFLCDPEKDCETALRQAGRVRRVLGLAARGIFLVSLAVTLCFYPGLPAQTGVHFIGVAYMPETHGLSETLHRLFAEYQEIDVKAAKAWLFYPYGVTGLMLLAGLLVPRLAGKLRAKNLSGDAKKKLAQGIGVTLDTVGLVFALYFCGIWTVQILRQQPMRVLFTELYVILVVLSFLELIMFTVLLSSDERRKLNKERSGREHD